MIGSPPQNNFILIPNAPQRCSSEAGSDSASSFIQLSISPPQYVLVNGQGGEDNDNIGSTSISNLPPLSPSTSQKWDFCRGNSLSRPIHNSYNDESFYVTPKVVGEGGYVDDDDDDEPSIAPCSSPSSDEGNGSQDQGTVQLAFSFVAQDNNTHADDILPNMVRSSDTFVWQDEAQPSTDAGSKRNTKAKKLFNFLKRSKSPNHTSHDSVPPSSSAVDDSSSYSWRNRLTNLRYNLSHATASFDFFSRHDSSSPAYIVGDGDNADDDDDDETSFLWFSYRSHISPPLPSGCDLCRSQQTTSSSVTPGLSCDTGWGCMLRSAQMLLAKTFQISLKRRPSDRQLASLFFDHPSSKFSIHNMICIDPSIPCHSALSNNDQPCLNKAGQWYGPNRICVLLEKLNSHRFSSTLQRPSFLENFAIKTIGNANPILSKPDLQMDFSSRSGSDCAMLLLCPVYLTHGKLTENHVAHLKKCLRSFTCVGLLGGPPKRCLYIVGYQDNHLLYLDPHKVQPVADPSSHGNGDPLKSYRMTHPWRMSATDLDPCLAFGFVIRRFADIDHICDLLDCPESGVSVVHDNAASNSCHDNDPVRSISCSFPEDL